MVKYTRKTLIILSIFSACLSENSVSGADLNDFIQVLAQIESSGNPKAINKSEGAKGIFQIRAEYFQDSRDFNRNLNKYNHNHCFNPKIAREVVISYFNRYEPKALKNGDWETLARLHNGGCGWRTKRGAAKNRLDIYWGKVNKQLTKLNKSPILVMC